MLYPITTTTASLLAIFLIVLAVRVILARRDMEKSDDGMKLFDRRDRALGNMIEYVPIALIMLFLLEAEGAPFWIVSLSAGLLLFGRLVHGIAFSFTSHWPFGRVGGTLCTYLSILLLAISGLWMAITA